MDTSKIEAVYILDRIIIGRVEPHIYAFITNTIPNYLKIGDTYRPVAKRLKEWREFFPALEKQYENKAVIDEEIYFRDYAIHQYLENDLNKERLKSEDLKDGIYYSREFFKNTTTENIDNAIEDIKLNYNNETAKYEYYSSNTRLAQTYHYARGENWTLRPNQQEAVNNFEKAIKNGRRNLLMYAVMRFGKSFTSLSCALNMKAKLVLVVSAKADVKDEWKKTVEGAGNFHEYEFLEADDLLKEENLIKERLKVKRLVIFLTLQDLQGDKVKEKHRELFNENIDLLIVDETHFGARAESFGKILQNAGYDNSDERYLKKLDDENIDISSAETEIKKLNAKIRLHLSGTPYRILMGSEFQKEDLIAFVQFSDIVKEQENWDKHNLKNDDVNEWDNPYFGFPQMVRFAFNPNASSRKKMEELKKSGVSFAFSKLFEPKSIKLDAKENNNKKFINEIEIIDLLQVIDGSKTDENLLGFLDYEKIKDGQMCRHMVMVLPYCASCDAMEELLKANQSNFKNLGEYEIINISGLEATKKYKKPNDIKNKIKEFEKENKKTITLTVNRMLTGSTVEEWDTMLYFKDTSSPQEYDQAIFRLQNQYIRTLSSDKGFIKENLKPQTLLVDFDPNRLFRMQEEKSLIYNANTEENGNSKLKERITEELRISPIIRVNHNKISMVEATNILEVVSEYNNKRSVSDEISDIPIDLSILDDEKIRLAIEKQAEFNSKQGLSINPNEGDGDDLEIDEPENIDNSARNEGNERTEETRNYIKDKKDEEIKKLAGQIKTYYLRILFFAFLTQYKVTTIEEILANIDKYDNARIAKNLGLDKEVLQKMKKYMNPFKINSLEYKIHNISMLANDESIKPINRAMTSINKFNRMSESEIITPSKVCDDMVNLFPEEGIKEIVRNKDKFLDIASKSGEFAVALYKKLTQDLGYEHEDVRDLIYSIPTSTIAYEFTRKFYEILDLNVENIALKFNSYDLLEVKDEEDNIDYEKIKSILKQNQKFCDISLNEEAKEGDEKVEFGAIIGNPPYQISDGGAKASAKPIYHNFILLGKKIVSNYACYIAPTRWFAGGKGLDEFRNIMLNDETLKELHDFLTPEDIFPNTNNRGGVASFVFDIKKTSKNVKIVTHKNGEKIYKDNRSMLIDGVDIFIRDSIGLKIIEKIKTKSNNKYLNEIVSARKPFGIESNFNKTKEFKFSINETKYSTEELKDYVICYAKGWQKGYIKKELVKIREEYINCYKVFVPRANNIGTELSDDNLNARVGYPMEICTESYIMIGHNLQLNESNAGNMSKYLMTKFSRFMHSLAKASQDASSKTYRFIPIQDFTEHSDIDWLQSLDEIDEQLFNKYNLLDKEREHIKTSIKGM